MHYEVGGDEETYRRFMAKGAEIALKASKTHCSAECASYHGVWLFTRASGALPSVDHYRKRMVPALASAIQDGCDELLISGAADFGILDLVARALHQIQSSPRITVVDRCETPLAVNRWYADKAGLNLRTYKSDILDFDQGRYDVIVAHNFLNFFSDDDKVRLFQRWAGLLRPGGSIVIGNNTKPDAPPLARRFADEKVEIIMQQMRQRGAELGFADIISEDDLDWMVRDYVKRRISHNIARVENLRQLLAKAGLKSVDVEPVGSLSEKVPAEYHRKRHVLTIRHA